MKQIESNKIASLLAIRGGPPFGVRCLLMLTVPRLCSSIRFSLRRKTTEEKGASKFGTEMGIPSTMRDAWANQRNSPLIASPMEDQKILRSRQCTQEGVRAGVKAASIACVASAVPTLVAVRVIPWAKSNLNYTAQALIISAASIAAYFIAADKTILECARRNAHYNEKSS